MYNRNWLKIQIAAYLKDQSLGAELDTFIDLGAKRVSQLLEAWEMEAEYLNSLRFALATGVDGGFADGSNLIFIDGGDAFSQDPEAAPTEFVTLGSKVKRVVGVQAYRNGEWYNLAGVPKHDAGRYKSSGVPEVYYLENRTVYPLPFAEGDYKVIVLEEVEIPVGDNEHPALTSYPFMFLNAALAEAWDWKQDPEMNARYEQKWQSEAEQVKILYRSEIMGETPAMRAF